METSQHNVDTVNYTRLFWITLAVTAIIKLILSGIIPVTGDEAYYAIWGEFPALGYYDHTPFIGWMLYPFLKLGHNAILLRLPTIILTTLIGLVIYRFLKPLDNTRAALTAIIFLISPLSLCAVLITTDTPVILFSFLSGICLLQAIRTEDHYGWYALSGLCLGLAFFSKYFAVLLALAYLFYFLQLSTSSRRYKILFILLLGVLPFGLAHLYWNYTHAWANILFNVYNRNVTDHFSIGTFLAYLASLFYIVTPLLFYYLFIKYKHTLFASRIATSYKALNCIIVIPLLFFLFLSTYKQIGLHWPLSFIPFVYIWAAIYLSLNELRKMLYFMLVFTGLHVLLILTLIIMPIQSWQKLPISDKTYTKVVYFFKHKAIRDQLNAYNNDYVFTSLNYVQADMMFYDSGLYAPTFGIGSVHGRQDDLMTDFREYANKNFLIFYTRKPRVAEYQPYFAQSQVYAFDYEGVTFYYVLGVDFNYAAYHDTVLRYINNTYWQIPSYLPHKPSFFCEKYFANEGCH